MRTFLLAATMLVPFTAFAGGSGMSAAGDLNVAKTAAGSTAGVQSSQGTHAQATAAGNGGIVVGAISGNYTAVDTTAAGRAGPGGSFTQTTATQTNIGGTAAAGYAINKTGRAPIALTAGRGQASGASGIAGGGQDSQAAGSSTASASNANIGGFVAVKPGRSHR